MIRSVDKAAVLLSTFTEENPVLGVGELSQRSGFHKSTVSRLMATLGRRGLVVQDSVTREYRIGPEVARLAQVYLIHAAHVQAHNAYKQIARDLHEAEERIEASRDGAG